MTNGAWGQKLCFWEQKKCKLNKKTIILKQPCGCKAAALKVNFEVYF